MKKEILIAIIIGFILGLVITFGIWTANKSLQENSKTQKTEVSETQPVVTEISPEEGQIPLIISSPENNALVNQEKIEIIGQTTAQATVIILYEEGEEVFQADEKGEFSQEITLVGGANEIKITAFDAEGNEANKNLNLVYSSVEI
ncbi:hypothetical protein COY29_01255 [Candidatus Woesebacteria bacterium CG_4_10_14_0_2_um_filter_39_14]|uniref:Bacterial Ig domain-containing protein n=3 Tax=Microgenomates group TaxID=1794810 RepID=A0A2M6YPC5_9BACT|nr:MAG: hypothetical protein COT04_02580 [Candidatus Shapirobacteria bacterium CG07_land_8_20_14_0_80_39_12]PIZ49677.1 MAG: hypothetical protein COY29_01255 [Candidatus Woesebacteria bacterium CG_4_10_14_0_2_um_filter_39_14]PJA50026.1 MAG: hypothetical protein CO169_00325 [Candidatus Shapirobacteria bacterium CG_4_9_14_3_um_filter_39_13]